MQLKVYIVKGIGLGMIDMNHDRALVFQKKELKVHVCKINGTFYNGIILEVSDDFFFMQDQKEGQKLVFFKELKKPIETFTEGGE